MEGTQNQFEKARMPFRFRSLNKILLSVGFSAYSLSAYAGVSLHSYQTHSHVTIPVDPKVNYQVEKLEQDGKVVGLRLIVNNVIGIQEDISGSAKLKDVRTQALNVKRTRGSDGENLVYEFIFSDVAKNTGVEYFDYRSKNPHEIQLDYWLKSQKIEDFKIEEPKVAKTETAPTKESEARVREKSKKEAKKLVTNKPKKVQKENLQVNSDVHCGIPLNRSSDAFVQFKVWHMPFDYKKYFNLMPADSKYVYPDSKPIKGEKLGKRSKEISHYRLAVKLYKEQKYALVLRTIDFFIKSYSQSPYIPELEFLKANTFMQLSRMLNSDHYKTEAFEMYRGTALNDSNSERGKAATAFLMQELLEEGNNVAALEYALIGADVKTYEANDITPHVYRLASAEILSSIIEMDRAERAYQMVIDAKNSLSPEAAFRIGEVFAARRFWERAILAYDSAIRKYPNHITKFPSTWFNMAESYYKIDRLDDAQKYFKKYLEYFPTEPMTWAAGFRIAEINQMLLKSPDVNSANRIEKGYESVVNQFPYTPGETLAHLRIASCHQNSDKDSKSDLYNSFFKLRNLKQAENALVEPLEVEILSDLSEARFHFQGKKHKEALVRIDSFRAKYSKLSIAESFAKIYRVSSVELVKEMANQGYGAEVLSKAESLADLTPKPEPFGFILALAKASDQIGKIDISVDKLDLIKNRLSEANDDEKDEFHLLNARLARLTGHETPEKIMAELNLIRDSGPFSAHKLDELAMMAMAKNDGKGDYASAVQYDSLLVKSDLYKKLPMDRQVDSHLRYIENLSRLSKNEEVAKFSTQSIIKFGVQVKYEKELFRMKELRAQALYDLGDDKAAVDALAELIQIDPKHRRLNEFEFERAKSLVRLGREDEAIETFRKLAKADGSNVWKKSAQAELDQLQWEGKINNNNTKTAP